MLFVIFVGNFLHKNEENGIESSMIGIYVVAVFNDKEYWILSVFNLMDKISENSFGLVVRIKLGNE